MKTDLSTYSNVVLFLPLFLGLILLVPKPVASSPSNFHYAQVLAGVTPHHTMINKATKDPDGMLWVLSGGLVYRYDGVNVMPLSRLYGNKLPFFDVDNLVADPWGMLWICTQNGLVLFNLDTWEFVDTDHPYGALLGRSIYAFHKDEQEFIVADWQGKVWSVHPDKLTHLFDFDVEKAQERRPVGRMLLGNSKHLWLAHGDRLYHAKLQGDRVLKCVSTPFPPTLFSRIEDMLLVEGGLLIRFYSLGYYLYDGLKFRELKRSTFTSEDFTNWNHWSFEYEDRIVVFHESKYLEFSRDTAFQLLYNGTQKMDEVILRKRLNTWQKEGDEWLLCTDRGLFSVFPRRIPFEHINTRSARGMIRQGNRYYFGGYGPLLSSPTDRFDQNLKPSSFENNFYDFLEWNSDTSFVSLEGDFLGMLVRGTFHPVRVKVKPGVREKFSGMAYCLAKLNEHTLLLGTHNGVWTYHIPSRNAAPLCDTTGDFPTRGMRIQHLSIRGEILHLSSNTGYFQWHLSQSNLKKIYPNDGRNLNVYGHEWHGGSIYLATKGHGLVQIQGDDRMGTRGSSTMKVSLLTDANGVEIVYQLKWVDDVLFMGTHQGLVVYYKDRVYHYYHSDGLPFEEFNHQAIYYDSKEQRLFMGGLGGYIFFNPTDLMKSLHEQPSRILLSSMRIGLKKNNFQDMYAREILGQDLHLPSDVNWISLDFAKPDRYRNAYELEFKISPFMRDFQHLSPASKVNLAGISAGKYRVAVRVKALNSDRVLQTEEWNIYKRPVFTETLGFYVLLCMLVCLIVGLVLWERVKRVRAEFTIRSKISKDLHDDVGGILTGISMQAELLKMRALASDIPGKISEQSRRATQMMDDIIWTVDARYNDQESLADRMKSVTRQMLEPTDIQIFFNFSFTERKISQAVRQNLFLIFKEAIHNICKHAQASKVWVGFEVKSGKILLTIKDNGIGRLGQTPHSDGASTFTAIRRGHGLRNMQLRAEEIGGTLYCGPEDDGFIVQISVPLRWKWYMKK